MTPHDHDHVVVAHLTYSIRRTVFSEQLQQQQQQFSHISATVLLSTVAPKYALDHCPCRTPLRAREGSTLVWEGRQACKLIYILLEVDLVQSSMSLRYIYHRSSLEHAIANRNLMINSWDVRQCEDFIFGKNLLVVQLKQRVDPFLAICL